MQNKKPIKKNKSTKKVIAKNNLLKKTKKKTLPKILGVVLIAALLGGGGYFYINPHHLPKIPGITVPIENNGGNGGETETPGGNGENPGSGENNGGGNETPGGNGNENNGGEMPGNNNGGENSGDNNGNGGEKPGETPGGNETPGGENNGGNNGETPDSQIKYEFLFKDFENKNTVVFEQFFNKNSKDAIDKNELLDKYTTYVKSQNNFMSVKNLTFWLDLNYVNRFEENVATTNKTIYVRAEIEILEQLDNPGSGAENPVEIVKYKFLFKDFQNSNTIVFEQNFAKNSRVIFNVSDLHYNYSKYLKSENPYIVLENLTFYSDSNYNVPFAQSTAKSNQIIYVFAETSEIDVPAEQFVEVEFKTAQIEEFSQKFQYKKGQSLRSFLAMQEMLKNSASYAAGTEVVLTGFFEDVENTKTKFLHETVEDDTVVYFSFKPATVDERVYELIRIPFTTTDGQSGQYLVSKFAKPKNLLNYSRNLNHEIVGRTKYKVKYINNILVENNSSAFQSILKDKYEQVDVASLNMVLEPVSTVSINVEGLSTSIKILYKDIEIATGQNHIETDIPLSYFDEDLKVFFETTGALKIFEHELINNYIILNKLAASQFIPAVSESKIITLNINVEKVDGTFQIVTFDVNPEEDVYTAIIRPALGRTRQLNYLDTGNSEWFISNVRASTNDEHVPVNPFETAETLGLISGDDVYLKIVKTYTAKINLAEGVLGFENLANGLNTMTVTNNKHLALKIDLTKYDAPVSFSFETISGVVQFMFSRVDSVIYVYVESTLKSDGTIELNGGASEPFEILVTATPSNEFKIVNY